MQYHYIYNFSHVTMLLLQDPHLIFQLKFLHWAAMHVSVSDCIFVWQILSSGSFSAPEADTGYAAPGIDNSYKLLLSLLLLLDVIAIE